MAVLRLAVLSSAALLASAQLVVPQLEGVFADLNPELVGQPFPAAGLKTGAGDNFVFLQKFPLKPISVFFHTEVLVCPRSGFSEEDQKFLDQQISGMTDFAEIAEDWWTKRTADCVELGYGGSLCAKECCSVGHRNMALNKRQAVIVNANVDKKTLFVYGTGSFDGDTAFHNTCDKKCWSEWKGTQYNPLTNNCNTFTSTVLSCVYGLSQKKPHLGVSDLVKVHGHCPNNSTAAVQPNLMV